MDGRYWCHACLQMVSPVMEAEIKCPFCDGGFVEEMDERGGVDDHADLESDRALSLWVPILLGMVDSSRRRRRFRVDDEDGDLDYEWLRDLDSILLRRRRSSALLRLLQAIRAGVDPDLERERSSDRGRERDRDNLLLINPLDQTIIFRGGSSDPDHAHHSNTEMPAGASLGDYYVGPSLDLLLQHLAENDPNRYGTPPARKEAVEALPTVKVENLGCPVCLEDFDVGAEAKEMPCKHRFHTGCILPWLDLHSSCPVCRFQIPADGSKVPDRSDDGNRSDGVGRGIGAASDRNSARFWLPVPWPLNEVFSLPGSRGSDNSSASASGSDPREDDD